MKSEIWLEWPRPASILAVHSFQASFLSLYSDDSCWKACCIIYPVMQPNNHPPPTLQICSLKSQKNLFLWTQTYVLNKAWLKKWSWGCGWWRRGLSLLMKLQHWPCPLPFHSGLVGLKHVVWHKVLNAKLILKNHPSPSVSTRGMQCSVLSSVRRKAVY